MAHLNIPVYIKFEESYLPNKKCTYERVRIVQENHELKIEKIDLSDAKLAFRVKKYDERIQDIYLYNDLLWRKKFVRNPDSGKNEKYKIPELIKKFKREASDLPYSCFEGKKVEKGIYLLDKEKKISELSESISNYLIVGNDVYESVDEPRYVVQTFGLGHNHGGTGMFVQFHYNSNIPASSYFPADKRKEAIEYGRQVAKDRGDTLSIKTIGQSYDIKVILPEAVKCNPLEEHGEGDPFINRLQGLISNSQSKTEAGLLVMAATAKELNK